METLEPMADFFASRVKGYDEHMLNEVEGCREGYREMARLVPQDATMLLDIGCGTGLELDSIYPLHPALRVTGIDLSAAMLRELEKKHGDKKPRLICGDYFETDFGCACFDCAVSFQTLHHFSHEKKLKLYKKIYASLKNEGIYIECDYMVLSPAEEDFYYSENIRIRKQLGIPVGAYYHYDTPCTVENTVKLLTEAGFSDVKKVFRKENTTTVTAFKGGA